MLAALRSHAVKQANELKAKLNLQPLSERGKRNLCWSAINSMLIYTNFSQYEWERTLKSSREEKLRRLRREVRTGIATLSTQPASSPPPPPPPPSPPTHDLVAPNAYDDSLFLNDVIRPTSRPVLTFKRQSQATLLVVPTDGSLQTEQAGTNVNDSPSIQYTESTRSALSALSSTVRSSENFEVRSCQPFLGLLNVNRMLESNGRIYQSKYRELSRWTDADDTFPVKRPTPATARVWGNTVFSDLYRSIDPNLILKNLPPVSTNDKSMSNGEFFTLVQSSIVAYQKAKATKFGKTKYYRSNATQRFKSTDPNVPREGTLVSFLAPPPRKPLFQPSSYDFAPRTFAPPTQTTTNLVGPPRSDDCPRSPIIQPSPYDIVLHANKGSSDNFAKTIRRQTSYSLTPIPSIAEKAPKLKHRWPAQHRGFATMATAANTTCDDTQHPATETTAAKRTAIPANQPLRSSTIRNWNLKNTSVRLYRPQNLAQDFAVDIEQQSQQFQYRAPVNVQAELASMMAEESDAVVQSSRETAFEHCRKLALKEAVSAISAANITVTHELSLGLLRTLITSTLNTPLVIIHFVHHQMPHVWNVTVTGHHGLLLVESFLPPKKNILLSIYELPITATSPNASLYFTRLLNTIMDFLSPDVASELWMKCVGREHLTNEQWNRLLNKFCLRLPGSPKMWPLVFHILAEHVPVPAKLWSFVCNCAISQKDASALNRICSELLHQNMEFDLDLYQSLLRFMSANLHTTSPVFFPLLKRLLFKYAHPDFDLPQPQLFAIVAQILSCSESWTVDETMRVYSVFFPKYNHTVTSHQLAALIKHLSKLDSLRFCKIIYLESGKRFFNECPRVHATMLQAYADANMHDEALSLFQMLKMTTMIGFQPVFYATFFDIFAKARPVLCAQLLFEMALEPPLRVSKRVYSQVLEALLAHDERALFVQLFELALDRFPQYFRLLNFGLGYFARCGANDLVDRFYPTWEIKPSHLVGFLAFKFEAYARADRFEDALGIFQQVHVTLKSSFQQPSLYTIWFTLTAEKRKVSEFLTVFKLLPSLGLDKDLLALPALQSLFSAWPELSLPDQLLVLSTLKDLPINSPVHQYAALLALQAHASEVHSEPFLAYLQRVLEHSAVENSVTDPLIQALLELGQLERTCKTLMDVYVVHHQAISTTTCMRWVGMLYHYAKATSAHPPSLAVLEPLKQLAGALKVDFEDIQANVLNQFDRQCGSPSPSPDEPLVGG